MPLYTRAAKLAVRGHIFNLYICLCIYIYIHIYAYIHIHIRYQSAQ
jgi:hypothetical protein